MKKGFLFLMQCKEKLHGTTLFKRGKNGTPSKNLPNSPSPGIALKSAVFCAPTKEEQACAYTSLRPNKRGGGHHSQENTIHLL
jgi:hypothetical protein